MSPSRPRTGPVRPPKAAAGDPWAHLIASYFGLAANPATAGALGPEDGRRLVSLACRAPSLANTQPWSWRLRDDGVELYADRSRQLTAVDPDGRELLVSCGAALHHLQVAALAHGFTPSVARFPDADPDHLADVRLVPTTPSTAAAVDLAALQVRCTDRRRFTSWPVSEDRLVELTRAAEQQGARALLVDQATERFWVELLVGRAQQVCEGDRAARDQQGAWLDRVDASGVDSDRVPAARPAEESYVSRFGTGTLLEPDRDVAGADALLVLCARQDTPQEWLRTGEGLSALWIRAVREGLSVLPVSQPIEVEETRRALQHEVTSSLGFPVVLLRVGWQALGRHQLAPSPRRPVDEVLRS